MLRWVDGNYQTRTNHAFVDIPKECLQRLKKTEKYRTIGLSYGDKKKVHGDAHSTCTKQVLNKQANRYTNKLSLQTFYWLTKKLNQPQGPFEYKSKGLFFPSIGC